MAQFKLKKQRNNLPGDTPLQFFAFRPADSLWCLEVPSVPEDHPDHFQYFNQGELAEFVQLSSREDNESTLERRLISLLPTDPDASGSGPASPDQGTRKRKIDDPRGDPEEGKKRHRGTGDGAVPHPAGSPTASPDDTEEDESLRPPGIRDADPQGSRSWQESYATQGDCTDSELHEMDLFLLLHTVTAIDYDASESVMANARDALLRHRLNLGALYRAFCRDAGVKKIACEKFRAQMESLKALYKQLKAEILEDLLGTTKADDGSPGPTTWRAKALRLLQPDREKTHYAVTPESLIADADCYWPIDVGDETSWFRMMITLSTIRKVLTERNRSSGQSVRHLTVLQFDGFSLFVVNHKGGTQGTSRMVWPLRSPDNAANVVRVLDMTYKEAYAVIDQIFLQQLGCTDSGLAALLLGVLRNDPGVIEELKGTTHALGSLFCSFLYGVGLGPRGEPRITRKNWCLSRKARAPKDLNKLDIEVSAYETACYILSILFLAEPRHALGMWRATLLALELVKGGHLTFRQLFGSLNGAIRHGRLLPGANVLGKVLAPSVSFRQVASGAHQDAIQILGQGQMPAMVLRCNGKPKRLAMPLVDGVLLASPEGVEWNCVHAIQQDGTDPIYQPLMKALFLEFLYLVGRNADANDPTPCANFRELERLARQRARASGKERFVPTLPKPRDGSDRLNAPPGHVAWGVTPDLQSLFRSAALFLDGDECLYGEVQRRIASYLISKLETDRQRATILIAEVASLVMGLRTLEELQAGYTDPHPNVAFQLALGRVSLAQRTNLDLVCTLLAEVCELRLLLFFGVGGELKAYGDEGPNGIMAVVQDLETGLFHLVMPEGRYPGPRPVAIMPGGPPEPDDRSDIDYIDGEENYDDSMPEAKHQ
jgi:hypothetical protein